MEGDQFYMSQQERRFGPATKGSNPAAPSLPAASKVAPRLPESPANLSQEDMTIHIDASGRKCLLNSRGEETFIQPYLNKFFGDYGREGADGVGEHNRRGKVERVKASYQRAHRVDPASRIYNYTCHEIMLLGQFYQSLVPEQEKQQIIGNYFSIRRRHIWVKSALLTYTIFLVATRRAIWSRLTFSPTTTVSIFTFGGLMWAKAAIDLGAFPVTSVMEHSRTFEQLLQVYENDYKIVY